MHNPPRPGKTLHSQVIEPLGLTIKEAADRLGISRVCLSRVCNGKAGISPNLAIRLETAGVSDAEFWLSLQMAYNLFQARQRAKKDKSYRKVKRLASDKA